MTPRLSMREIKILAQDRLGESLVHELAPGGRREGHLWSAPNPARGKDGSGSFKVYLSPRDRLGGWVEYDSGEKGDLIDLVALRQGCDRKGAVDWLKARLGIANEPAAALRRVVDESRARAGDGDRQRREQSIERAREIWNMGRSINPPEGIVVLAYLASRGIAYHEIISRTGLVRVVPELEHWASAPRDDAGRRIGRGHVGPAMVCPMYNAAGYVSAVHCTWLEPDGSGKARIAGHPAKLMRGEARGAFVPIARPSATQAPATLIICEGIETGFSLALAVPEARVWAAASLGNIGNMPVGLGCVERIVVAIENDVKPQAIRQREAVLDRLRASGKPVTVMTPPTGSDFNDVLKG